MKRFFIETGFLVAIFAILFGAGCGKIQSKIDEAQALNSAQSSPKDCDTSPQALASLQGTRINGPAFKILCQDSNVDETPPVVTATPGEGTYGVGQYVTLVPSEDSTIFYTLDGSEPDANSFKYSQAIYISASTVLRFYGVDPSGNVSPQYTLNYTINSTVPTVSVINVDRPAVSGDPMMSAAVNILFNVDQSGSYRVEKGGIGLSGSGQLLVSGTYSVGTTASVTIPGASFEIGANTVYIYVTNNLGVTGYTTQTIIREDDPPSGGVNVAGALYGAAQDVTVSISNEPYGVAYIYYTTDGTDPLSAADDTSGNCGSYPYLPAAGMRCAVSNSTSTSPIHIQPYLPAGCNPSVDCNPLVDLKYVAIDKAGNIGPVGVQNYNIDMINPQINLTTGAVIANANGSIDFSFAMLEDGDYQVVLNPSGATKATWDADQVLNGGSVTAGASQNVSIAGSVLPGPSGTASEILVRAKDNAGRVGTASFIVYRDDVAPTAYAVPGAGTYGASQFMTGGAYQSGVQINSPGGLGAPVTIYYTTDGSTPSATSASVTAGGYVDVLTASEKTSGLSGDKIVTIKWFAQDSGGTATPIYTDNYTILQSGSSLTITSPTGAITIARHGFKPVKVFNSSTQDQEYAVSQQWGSACYNDGTTGGPFTSGELLEQGTILATSGKWVNVYDDMFPAQPYNPGSFPSYATSSAGSADVLYFSDVSGFTVGDEITYDSTDKAKVLAVDTTNKTITITPPLANASASGKTVQNWGQGNQRLICIYSRLAGSGGAWIETATTVISDYDAPLVNFMANPNGVDSYSDPAIDHQYLADTGNKTAIISFKVDPQFSGDETLPATYTIRKVVNAGTPSEAPQDILASGTVLATGQLVYASVPVAALPTGQTDFRIYVKDRSGNYGKSSVKSLYRDDSIPTLLASGVTCTYQGCSVTLAAGAQANGSQSQWCAVGGSCSNVGTTGMSNTLDVPLQENASGNQQGATYVDIQGALQNGGFSIDGGINNGNGANKVWWPYIYGFWGNRASSDPGDWCTTLSFKVQATKPGAVQCRASAQNVSAETNNDAVIYMAVAYQEVNLGSGYTVTTNVSANTIPFDWTGVTLTTYTYTGSKIFTFKNQYGIQVNLLADCDWKGGCLLSQF